MRRFEIFLDSAWHDISKLYVPGTYTLQKQAMNTERKSSVSSASLSIRFDERLCAAIEDSFEPVGFRVWRDYDIEFDGQMDPVFSVNWNTLSSVDTIPLELVDFSVKLDEYVSQSASYPAAVGGPAFPIFVRENKEASLLYRILELAGLSGRISRDAPDINQGIKHMAWSKGDATYRDLIDGLLSDYGYCLKVEGESLTWFPTAVAKIGNVDDIRPCDIIGRISKDKRYQTYNGVSVEWPKTKIIENALLWRGNLPIGDTSNPRPGEAIAAGDYWPEDSDIIETWQDYGTDYLDTDYLEGKTRLKNEELALISSSNWRLEDKKDESVKIDPITESQDIVYEALRARLRYKNTGTEAARLYYANIYGDALIKSYKVTTSYPENCSNPDVYQTAYVFDKESAERLTKIRWMYLRCGCFNIQFNSPKRFEPGAIYRLEQRGLFDGYVQITSSTETDGNSAVKYTACSIAAFEDVSSTSQGTQGSGAASPGQDGASPRFIYMRSYTTPSTPVGEKPSGWTFDKIPDGLAPVWMSMGMFTSTGNLQGSWSAPTRIEATDGGSYRGASPDIPENPLDGDFFLYTGATNSQFTQYHLYKYSAIDEVWNETTDSDVVMAAQKDALQIAKETGTLIYAALIFVDLLVARNLSIGSGSLQEGLLCRFMEDDGNGNPVIEIRNNGEVLFYLDVKTGKLYGNFAEVVQYLPYTFNDSLDSSHPAIFDFYIPEGKIDYVKVSVKGQKFRTYSAATETITGPIWTLHTSSVTLQARAYYERPQDAETSEEGEHAHGLYESFGEIVGTDSAGEHTHLAPAPQVSISPTSHYHIIDINHSHAIELGIIEGTSPTGMTLAVSNDGGSSYQSAGSIGNTTRDKEVNITTSGWKSIRITSTQNGRVQVQVMVKIRIDTEK